MEEVDDVNEFDPYEKSTEMYEHGMGYIDEQKFINDILPENSTFILNN